jgi:gliding motility-associated-like protein
MSQLIAFVARVSSLTLRGISLAFLIVWVCASSALASHGLAGEITYTYLPDPGDPGRFTNTYRIRLTTYTNPCAAGVHDCNATIEVWAVIGTNRVKQTYPALENIQRINGLPGASFSTGFCPREGERLRTLPGGGCVYLNIYEATITFRGQGTFELRYFRPARIAGVVNMSNSGNVNWAVETTLFNVVTRGVNNSPRLLNAPIDDACTNTLWTHNPGGFDPDGDSLSYELVPSQVYDPPFIPRLVSTPGYNFPSALGGTPATNQFSINVRSGLVTWRTPQLPGIYNFAFRVIEWRNGIRISDVLRDMAIIVSNCANRPPEIRALLDTCVKPNQTLNFPIAVRDPDLGDSLFLYLNNGLDGPNAPFLRGATITPPNNPNLRPQLGARNPTVGPNPVTTFAINTQFSWPIECTDIRAIPWQVDLYANDDFSRADGQPTLAANHITTIRVIGPPVTNLSAIPGANRTINLSWSAPSCPNIIGYEIYRAADSLGLPNDSCCSGGPGAGYVRIAAVNGRLTTTFSNGPNLEFRGRYCYRVAAIYTPSSGRNVVGCPSNEACVTLRRDFPVLLNNDIQTTNTASGSLALRWRSPNISTFNPVFDPLPYTYRLYQASGISGTGFPATPIEQGIAFGDTQRTITNRNTVLQGYSYRVDLHDAAGDLLSQSDPASSIFLTATPANEAVSLSFQSLTGWVNSRYRIYRADSINGAFVQIDLVNTPTGASSVTYIDRNLTPGVRKCYYVEGEGSFNNATVHTGILLNKSNRVCAVPIDTVPPCAPNPAQITAVADCDNFSTKITIQTGASACASDFEGYIILYKPKRDDPDAAYVARDTIRSIGGGATEEFVFTDALGAGFIGCYAIQALDTSGNTSKPTEPICLGAECPYFALPNVFTPNGDGANDRFIPVSIDPYSARTIKRIVCYIYDRWGRLVSTSTNKDNLWDGRVGSALAAEGTYFYVVEVVFQSPEPDRTFTRRGSVSLLR